MDNLTEQIDKLFAENKGTEAECLMKQALQEAYEAKDYTGAIPILNELIGYCRETSQVEQSYAYAEQVQALLKELGLEGSMPHATTLLNIANAYRAGGRLEDSLEFYGRVKEIYSELLPEEDTLWASFYNNLSLLYQEFGRHELAKEALLKALSIVVTKKDMIFEQAVTYTNLAASCLQLGQRDEAQKYFTGAIRLFEKYDIKDAHYCAALSSLATFYFQGKEYGKAAEYFKKAMEGIEASLGRNEYYYRMQENLKLSQELCGVYEEKTQTKAPVIKGLTLSREYYEAYGKPMLETEFAEYIDQIAVGLVGEGSDCFGFDDEASRDHDWGPSFCMWINDALYEAIGEKLQAAYDKLPKEFKGFVYKETPQAKGRRGVQRIEDFYRKLLGEGNCPDKDSEWSVNTLRWETIEEPRLAAAVNGEVFVDASGEFSAIRELLQKGYPKKLWYLKLAEAVAKFSQDVQYNYDRMLKRGDKAAAKLMLAEGVKEALKVLYYVDGKYAPHDKWLFEGLRGKAEYAEILQLLEQVLTDTNGRVSAFVEEVAGKLALLLYQADIISDVDSYLQEHVAELLYKAGIVELSIEELADRIAKLEFKAFDKVKNEGGRADCQDDWFTFSVMRKSQYLTWNQTMLLQYEYDFNRELSKGHNLIEEKYGRMMESTAPSEYEKIKENFPVLTQEKKQIIEGIVAMQVQWMEEFAAEYPKLAGNARSIHTYEDHMFNTSYETYLRGEISTYSDKMLELYARYIVEYARGEKNPARDIMEHSVLLYGYEGLDEAEAGL